MPELRDGDLPYWRLMVMHEYKVHVSDFTNVIVEAETAKEAKELAWEDISGGYTYGWKNKAEFMRSVKAEKVS
jgi:hypothetical protein